MGRIFFPFMFLLCLFANSAHAERSQFQPRTLGFHLGGGDPYPSFFGFGLTHYFHEFIGVSAMVGLKSVNDPRPTTFGAGIRFLATREKITPALYLGVTSFEDDAGARLVNGTIGAGINISLSRLVYMGAGANFGLAPRPGIPQILPFFQLGVIY